ncbi:MAG: TolB family protein, partial [Polyangiaceae bacterium]
MPKRRSFSLLVGLVAGGALAAIHAGCGSSDNGSTFTQDSGAGGSDTGTGTEGGPGFGGDGSTGPFADFPATPIIDGAGDGGPAAPANASTLFGAATASDAGADAPCLVENEVGSLLPKNWLRPRFGWQAGGGENLFEIRVHADNQINDLVVYTTQNNWIMPLTMWSALARDSAGVPMTVSVRGAVFDGTNITSLAQGSTGPFGIAPVDAPGAIVYWHIIGGSDGELKGFNIGDDNVELALPAASVTEYSATCVGCHVSTPDGKYAVFSSNSASSTWADGIGAVTTNPDGGGAGATPSFLSAAGQTALQTDSMGIMTTSIAHWAAGDYMVLASSVDNLSLHWVELDGADQAHASGTLPITSGDPNSNHVSPSWSHDGMNVVYGSAPQSTAGRPNGPNNDIYMVPYNNRAGGAAKPMLNINTTDNEYYPSFSPDDKLITFNRSANADG